MDISEKTMNWMLTRLYECIGEQLELRPCDRLLPINEVGFFEGIDSFSLPTRLQWKAVCTSLGMNSDFFIKGTGLKDLTPELRELCHYYID